MKTTANASVSLISLGPGDPSLLTLAAAKAIESVDILYIPFSERKDGSIASRTKDIILAAGLSPKQIVPFQVPMSKNRERALQSYERVANDIIDRLCNQDSIQLGICSEGHCGFYSSIFYISSYLSKEKISVQHIAGIPAFIAAGALAKLHIAEQDQNLMVLPGVLTEANLQHFLSDKNTNVVIMKPSKSAREIQSFLRSKKLPFSVHYFENVGVEGLEFYTEDINEIVERSFPYFSLLILKPKELKSDAAF